MPVSPWQRRIQRAQELAGQHPFAAEILGFYAHVARFQEDLHQRLSTILQSPMASVDRDLTASELSELSSRFELFLSMAEAYGPKPLAGLSRELQTYGRELRSELLNRAWMMHSASDAEGLLAQAFLQPYAELLRSRASLRPGLTAYALCPFCSRKPALGVLRQMGDGGARSMVCSCCLAEWEFRRIVCPGCGEEDDQQLAVFTATDSITYAWNVAMSARPTSRPWTSRRTAAPSLWSTNSLPHRRSLGARARLRQTAKQSAGNAGGGAG